MGDAVMKQISQYCSTIFRESDLMGRFSGDKFVVIPKGISLEGGKKKAEQLSETIKSIEVEYEGKFVSITASVGLVDNAKGKVSDLKELFNSADIVLC